MGWRVFSWGFDVRTGGEERWYLGGEEELVDGRIRDGAAIGDGRTLGRVEMRERRMMKLDKAIVIALLLMLVIKRACTPI